MKRRYNADMLLAWLNKASKYMFSRKYPVVFVSKNHIEFGAIIFSPEPSFEAGENFPYTNKNFCEIFQKIFLLQGKKVHMVLSEELVYTVALYFPINTELTREMVRIRVEEVVPESLKAAKWDFRTIQYIEHSKQEDSISLQVVVIEQSFAEMLERALEETSFSVESILPESYVLASFEKNSDGVTVIVEQNKGNVLFLAASRGLVLCTVVHPGEITDSKALENFLAFATATTGKRVDRIIGSHLTHGRDILASFEEKGYQCSERDYNPLLGVFIENSSGKDESVLNLNTLFVQSKKYWWQGIF